MLRAFCPTRDFSGVSAARFGDTRSSELRRARVTQPGSLFFPGPRSSRGRASLNPCLRACSSNPTHFSPIFQNKLKKKNLKLKKKNCLRERFFFKLSQQFTKTLLSAHFHGIQTKVSRRPVCRPLGVCLAPPSACTLK